MNLLQRFVIACHKINSPLFDDNDLGWREKMLSNAIKDLLLSGQVIIRNKPGGQRAYIEYRFKTAAATGQGIEDREVNIPLTREAIHFTETKCYRQGGEQRANDEDEAVNKQVENLNEALKEAFLAYSPRLKQHFS